MQRTIRTMKEVLENSESSTTAEPIERSPGVTESERYLKKLCDGSFLSLWSYPSLFRDQKGAVKGDGKEVCDLLVVFGSDVIIFSDKHCAFPTDTDIDLAWSRWFRRAIASSAHQAWGAERWIRSHPDRLFLDKNCAKPFPLELPDMRRARFHLVVVAHDVARRCQKEFGGSGSLMLSTDLKGLATHEVPFTIGDLDPERSFVHVLDDTTLDTVLRTLDTISDFTAYLRKKEALLRSGRDIVAAGDEELLAVYLKNLNAADEHDFTFPRDATGIILAEGHWEEFQKNPQRKAQIEANEISYVWDGLIERFSHYALAGQQFYSSPPGIDSSEKILRFLAREPRTRRRMLGRSLVEILRRTPANMRATRVIKPSLTGDPYYVFLLLPLFKDHSYEDNRTARRSFLEACCRVVKLKFPDAQDIVGIATESGFENGGRSEDAVFLDAREWNDELSRQAEIDQKSLQIFINMHETRSVELEYPEVVEEGSRKTKFTIPPNPRNKLCPCGSGKKYKRCHGR